MDTKGKSIEEEVESRVRVAIDAYPDSEDCLRAVMEVLRVALVLKAREAYVHSYKLRGFEHPAYEEYARTVCPLPTRTQQVLREEWAPGLDRRNLFRVQGGVLEWTPNPIGEVNGKRWHRFAAWYGHNEVSSEWALIRHALDLHDNPYRTVEVPADENNPWGDAEVSSA